MKRLTVIFAVLFLALAMTASAYEVDIDIDYEGNSYVEYDDGDLEVRADDDEVEIEYDDGEYDYVAYGSGDEFEYDDGDLEVRVDGDEVEIEYDDGTQDYVAYGRGDSFRYLDDDTFVKVDGDDVLVDDRRGTKVRYKEDSQGRSYFVEAEVSDDAVRVLLEGDDEDAEIRGLDVAVGNLRVTPGRVVAGDVSVDRSRSRFVVDADGTSVVIRSDEETVVIVEDEYEVEVESVEVSNGRIVVRDVAVVPPSRAVQRDEGTTVVSVRIEDEDDKVVYKVKQQRRQRFLGLVSVTVDEDVTVDASDGTRVRVRGPWWGFLAFG